MAYTIKKRNTPVATLIKNYLNKKSGKVSESREEIQKRFDYLDWKDQKSIIVNMAEFREMNHPLDIEHLTGKEAIELVKQR